MKGAGAVVGARAFISLRRHRNFRLYFFGQLVSTSGTWMQNVAMAWLVVQLTGSPIAVGILGLCQFGPYMVFGLFGGIVSDRYDKRRIYMTTQTISMLLSAVLAVLAATHLAVIIEVYAVATLGGMVMVVETPARQALTMDMVGRAELPNAVALNSSVFNLSRVAGPALGGLIIATAGVAVCFGINAISFVAVLIGLARMRTSELFGNRRPSRNPTVLRGTAEGLAYAWSQPAIRTVLLMLVFIGGVGVNFNVLLPILAARTLRGGPEVFGLITAGFGLGALGGALLSATRARANLATIVVAGTGFGIAELALAPLHNAVGAGVVLAGAGLCFSVYASNSNALIQLNTPDQLRGRVLSVYAYIFFGSAPLGGLLSAWLASRGGTELAFAVAGAVVVATAGSCGVALRRERNSTPPPPPTAAAL